MLLLHPDWTGVTHCYYAASLSHLQLVQNAAARLLTETKKYTSTSPVLASLHWLPVKFRIKYKMLLFVLKGLNWLAHSCISELLQLHISSNPLGSVQR